MSSPFPCSPVIRQCSWEKTHIENKKALKENGILLPKFAQNVIEARFLRDIIGSDYLLGYWFEIKFPEILLYFYMTVSP